MVDAVQFLQSDDEVTILYQRGQTVRHIYLDDNHPASPPLRWFGHSVGHYEGPNTLVIDTIGFYLRLTSGTNPIAIHEGEKTSALIARVARGDIGAFLCPDWRLIMTMKEPSLSGKIRLRPLPVFSTTDAPTSTFGGTLIGITRACPDPDAAWAMIERILLSPEAHVARQRMPIMPATPGDWGSWSTRDTGPFFTGESPGRLFARLAAVVPERRATPAAERALHGLIDAVNRLTGKGHDRGAIEAEMERIQLDTERRLAHEAF